MNFLAHALLSFDDPEILTGNMIADFVKGRKRLEEFPSGIRNGILLHRKIDEFTDHQLATLKAKNIFRPDYRLYSGAFVDIVFDHFLANDPRYFESKQDLAAFTEDVYTTVRKQESYFPQNFNRLFQVMTDQNWLFEYHSFKGLKQGLRGVSQRAKYLSEWEKSFELTIGHYYELNQHYFELMDDLVIFVKKELKELNSDSSSLTL